MMMTKPAPNSNAVTKSGRTEMKKRSSPEDAVKDLEKRLQMLETSSKQPPASSITSTTTTTTTSPPPTLADATVSATASVAKTTTVGKNPLLARIMAAQERAKYGQAAPAGATTTAPAAAPDLLDSFDTPAESESAPPPHFDVSLLPPQQQEPEPPAFDESLLPPPPIPKQFTAPDVGPGYAFASPPVASAPVFEDLLDHEEEHLQMPPPSSSSSYNVTPVAPPLQQEAAGGGLDQDAIDAILGIEGLSDQDKAALIAEQEKILASIEAEKKKKASPNSAAARADAFEQRSHAAAVQAIGGGMSSRSSAGAAPKTVDLGGGNRVALHGQAMTHEAIKDGTAVLVQCLSCESWMQVTGTATMMFCPNCQTVSPVVAANSIPAEDRAAVSQLAADLELAEQLQKEEYKKAEKRQAAAKKTMEQTQASPKKEEPSWMEWLGFGTPAPTQAVKPQSPDRSFAQKPLQRGEIGMSLPPGASRNNTALAMAPAYTGEEDDVDIGGSGVAASVQYSASYDSAEREFGDSGGGGGARVAKQQPLFSCVADSISLAATSLYNAAAADSEGNVHGVDTQGLLAVTQAGRENQSLSGGGHEYQKMDSHS